MALRGVWATLRQGLSSPEGQTAEKETYGGAISNPLSSIALWTSRLSHEEDPCVSEDGRFLPKKAVP
jgi:hypothetical protein